MPMMNLSELFTSIKMDLGLYGIALPFPDENQILHNTIKLKTIKTFSQFYPHVMRLDINLDDFNCIKSHYNESIYEIPDVFAGRRIMYIRKIDQKNKLLGNGYVNPVLDDSMDMYNSLMLGQAAANLTSAAVPPFTFKYIEPNLLYLYNMTTMANELTIEFALEHFDNLVSIPATAWQSFYDLALLDIKDFLYGVLKHYDQLQTAYGTITLKIDDWQQAASDRKDLIEKWRDLYHLDTEQFFII
jgi:hypothetical protein